MVLNEELSLYAERLTRDAEMHRELICWANRHSMQDTEAYSYWKKELELREVAAQGLKESLKELYPDGWELQPRNLSEHYGDELGRLFPTGDEGMHIGGRHCKNITIQVTEDCNLACTYCYQGHKTHNKMDFETAKAFIDYLFGDDPYLNSAESVGIILDFIGGEPLLEIELIHKICDYFTEKAFTLKHQFAVRHMFSMSSNGLLYFEPAVQDFIADYGHILSFSISIDGNKELHDACRLDHDGNGSYERAMKAVNHYRDYWRGYIGSKMTIAPDNVDKVFTAVTSMIENGYDNINLNYVHEEGWTIEHARTLYSELIKLADYLVAMDKQPRVSIFGDHIGKPMSDDDNQNWCGGNGLMLAVDRHGLLYPCIRYMESSLCGQAQPYIIGNIEHGVCEKEKVDCLSCITRRSQSTDECYYCPIASGCAWCTAYNYQVTGTPNKRLTFICVMHKARVLANEYYMKKLGIEYEIDMPQEWRDEILGGGIDANS